MTARDWIVGALAMVGLYSLVPEAPPGVMWAIEPITLALILAGVGAAAGGLIAEHNDKPWWQGAAIGGTLGFGGGFLGAGALGGMGAAGGGALGGALGGGGAAAGSGVLLPATGAAGGVGGPLASVLPTVGGPAMLNAIAAQGAAPAAAGSGFAGGVLPTVGSQAMLGAGYGQGGASLGPVGSSGAPAAPTAEAIEASVDAQAAGSGPDSARVIDMLRQRQGSSSFERLLRDPRTRRLLSDILMKSGQQMNADEKERIARETYHAQPQYGQLRYVDALTRALELSRAAQGERA